MSTSGDVTTVDYWVDHVRDTVRFHENVTRLGDVTLVEVGPDAQLTAMVDGLIPTLTRIKSDVESMLTALSQVHVDGINVDWAQLYTGGRRVDVPTYAFEHQSYWPENTAKSDVRSAGLGAVEHPLLGAAVELAGGAGYLFTARLSRRSWLADHTVHGAVLVPGAALVELAVRAADEVGLDRVEELTLAAPLVLPESGGVQVQLIVGVEENGRRSISVYSRAEGAVDEPWTEHATGVLGSGADRRRGRRMAAARGGDRRRGRLRAVRGERLRVRARVPGAAGGVA